MSQLTPEELREFPQKPRWTPEESLALYEIAEGFEHINGLATPQHVQTRDDRVRWANSVRVARMMFADRGTYTD
jgi:hypothetical protein